MADLKLLASRALGMALGLVLFPALYEPAFGQVKTNVPDVVAGARPARMERITIHGKALEGNLEGNAVDRTVLVILPPSYATERNRRYPVVYALHGYSIGAEQWSQEIHVPQTVEGAFAKGAREMIVVLPDSKTVHNGSMYSSSVTTGDFENFIARDVVSYIDAHYRTMPNRSSRGLVGHSMGGYGASRIGMKHADVFGSLYIMSPCCLAPRGSGPANPANEEALAAVKTPEDSAKLPFGLRAQLASAAAWSPNPNNPPLYLDLPTGSNQQEVLAKWAANSPLAFVDQYVQDLRQYRAIAIDVGDMDNLKAGASKLHDVLTSYGITHDFEIYSGTHTSHVAVRFQENVMPFFGKTLSFETARRLQAANGSADTHAYWIAPPPSTSTLHVMDQWLTAISLDRAPGTISHKIVRNRPEGARSGCWIDGMSVDDLVRCDAAYPYFREPRSVAGDRLTLSTMKCELKALKQSDYSVRFTDAEWNALRTAFPTGVCDFSRPGVGFQPSVQWLTYDRGPVDGRSAQPRPPGPARSAPLSSASLGSIPAIPVVSVLFLA